MIPKHYSPSQISSFISYRSEYIAGRVLGDPFQTNAHMQRGFGVEEGIEQIICHKKSLAEAVEAGLRKYDDGCRELTDRAGVEKWRSVIADSIKHGAQEFLEYGTAGSFKPQNKISTKLDGSKVEIIGYTDFELPEVVYDLKSTSRTPSGISDAYKIQGAIYNLATGKKVVFVFVIPLKTGVKVKAIPMTESDISYGIELANCAVAAMDDFWSSVPAIMTETHRKIFRSLAFPDICGMYKSEEKRAALARLSISK